MTIDISFRKIGRLFVIMRDGSTTTPNGTKKPLWICKCECGTFVKVRGENLRIGNTRSCGCLRREIEVIAGITHGMTDTPTHQSWRGMKERCTNKNNSHYKYYGGRGIKFCERWNNFQNFIDDMGERPAGKTLDRINNDGDYEPTNCRWATKQEQVINRRSRKEVAACSQSYC